MNGHSLGIILKIYNKNNNIKERYAMSKKKKEEEKDFNLFYLLLMGIVNISAVIIAILYL